MDGNDDDKKNSTIDNINYIIFFCLSTSVALAFADFFSSIFNTLIKSHVNMVIAKGIYLVLLTTLTLLLAYYFLKGGKITNYLRVKREEVKRT